MLNVFEVHDNSKLLPLYLMAWLSSLSCFRTAMYVMSMFVVVFLHVATCECQWDTKFAFYGIPSGIRTIGAVPSCNGSSTGPQRTCVFGNTTCLSGRSFITAWSVSIARAKWCHLARNCPWGSIYYPIKSNWWILLIETSITRSLSVFYFFFGGGGRQGDYINHMNIKMKLTKYIVTYPREKQSRWSGPANSNAVWFHIEISRHSALASGLLW